MVPCTVRYAVLQGVNGKAWSKQLHVVVDHIRGKEEICFNMVPYVSTGDDTLNAS